MRSNHRIEVALALAALLGSTACSSQSSQAIPQPATVANHRGSPSGSSRSLTMWLASPTGGGFHFNGIVEAFGLGGGTPTQIPSDTIEQGQPYINFNPAGLTSPYYLALDPSGNMWIADTFTNFILAFSTTSSPPKMIPTTALVLPDKAQPEQIAFDKNGNLWVGQVQYRPPNMQFVSAYSVSSGTPTLINGSGITTWTTPEGGSQPFYGVDVAFDPAGHLWAETLDQNTGRQVLAEFNVSNPSAPQQIPSASIVLPQATFGSFAFDASGNLWISLIVPVTGGSCGGPNLVSEYSTTNGSLLTSFSTIQDCAFAMAIDPSGNLWVDGSSTPNGSAPFIFTEYALPSGKLLQNVTAIDYDVSSIVFQQ